VIPNALAEASINLSVERSCHADDEFTTISEYGWEVLAWIDNTARLLAVAAANIQRGEPLPPLPVVPPDFEIGYEGPQTESEFWPGTKMRRPAESAAPAGLQPEQEFHGGR
jgi:hypothetical protein